MNAISNRPSHTIIIYCGHAHSYQNFDIYMYFEGSVTRQKQFLWPAIVLGNVAKSNAKLHCVTSFCEICVTSSEKPCVTSSARHQWHSFFLLRFESWLRIKRYKIGICYDALNKNANVHIVDEYVRVIMKDAG